MSKQGSFKKGSVVGSSNVTPSTGIGSHGGSIINGWLQTYQ